jgi:tetratricopeptide (TPR) repeat protein
MMERDVLLSRFRPWINAAAVAAVFAALAALVLTCPLDDLLFSHLAAGDRILEQRAVPRSEEFTYTAFGLPWTDLPWLHQAGLAALRRAGGLPAVVVVHALLWIGIFSWLFRAAGGGRGAARAGQGGGGADAAGRAAIVLAAGTACGPWLRAGEAVAAALLLAALALLGAALGAADARRRWILWGALPALALAGANLHERFVLVLLATALVAVDRLMAGARGWALGSADSAPAFAAAADALVGLALQSGAALLNPYGARALRLPFELALDPRGVLPLLRALDDDGRPILSGGLAPAVGFALAALLVAALALILFRPGGARLFEATFLLILMVLALRARRDLPPLALAAAYFALRRLRGTPGGEAIPAGAPASPRSAPLRAAATILAAAVAVAGVWVALDALRPSWPPRTSPLPAFRPEPDEYPEGAARFIAGSALPGQVFHSLPSGGWLLDAWKRDRRVFADSRREPFEHGVLARYLEAIDDPEAFERAADKYQITAVLWPHKDADRGATLLRHLASPGRWGLAAIDAGASVWVRADALSPAIVRNAPLVPGQTLAGLAPALLSDLAARPRRGPPVREAALGAFFAAAGEPAGAETFLRRAIERAPRAAPLWIRLGEALEGRGDREGALQAWRTAAGLRAGGGEAEAALGRLALEAGDLDEAQRRLDAATRAGDERPATLAARARLADRRGREAEARSLFAAALRAGAERDVLVAAAGFEGAHGGLEAALDLYARARARRPDDPVIAAEAAALLETAGRFADAMEIARGPAEGARARTAAAGGATAADRRLLEVAARVARRAGEPERALEWEKAIAAAGGAAPRSGPATPGR